MENKVNNSSNIEEASIFFQFGSGLPPHLQKNRRQMKTVL